MSFQEINIKDLQINPFQLIGNDWLLITAGQQDQINTMTASWGGLGIMWGENVATVYIRPQRYTKTFVDQEECFSLSFFNGYKKEMGYLGKVSGKDTDKIAEVGLTPIFIDGVPTFKEASCVFIVEKKYVDTIKPECFIDETLDEKWYPNKDHHFMYICKIKKIYTQDI